MLELLAGLLLATGPADPPAYERPLLTGFVAAASSRPVDGIEYGDNGVLGVALLWSHPAGFFAGTELFAGRGDGAALPDERMLGAQSFAGVAVNADAHRFALELLDYRTRLDRDLRLDNQGVGLRYRLGGFQAELAFEKDRHYYYPAYDRFFTYDNARMALGFEQPLNDTLRWSAGIGASHADRIDITHYFGNANLHGRWRSLEWQLGFSYATDELEAFYGAKLDRRQWLLRVALPFRAF